MPIYNDLLTITGADQSIPAPIESDFFTNGFDLPENAPSAPQPRLQPQSPLKDWRLVVDRAFMRGLSAADIIKGIGAEIAGHPAEAEIRAYLAKYEGLIGTVFVDSAVIAAGFPPSRIPRSYAPYHRFAINCRDSRTVSRRRADGGISGDIDAFLNSMDGIKEDTLEVCRLTGLPVLHKGDFTPAVIADLLKQLDAPGSTLADLQAALKKQCLGLGAEEPAAPAPAEADLDFGLKAEDMDAPVAEAPEEDGDIFAYNLSPAPVKVALHKARSVAVQAAAPGIKADVAIAPAPAEAPAAADFGLAEAAIDAAAGDAPGRPLAIQPDYAPPAEDDIAFEAADNGMAGVQLDGGLRF